MRRTHPFTSADGRRVRVVEREDGSYHLEGCDGLQYLGPGNITGPEILKLASQGSDLWNGLRRMVELISVREGIPLERLARVDAGVAEALALLDATAATFDHNEPEETLGDVLDAFKAGIAVGPVGSPEYLAAFAEATAKRDAPIPLVPSDIVTAVRKEIHRGED